MDAIARLTCTLEKNAIHCCIVGVAALRFYGAERVQQDWEVCIAPEDVERTRNLLESDLADAYNALRRRPSPQPASLAHTYSRFGIHGSTIEFRLVPSSDAHLNPRTICRCPQGIPYPTLQALIQSFIDTNNDVALCDIIDATDVSEEWAHSNLLLDGTNDREWAVSMNARLAEQSSSVAASWISRFPTATVSRRQMWLSRVSGKTARLGWTQTDGSFQTRFRLKDLKDMGSGFNPNRCTLESTCRV